ncbi:MAG: hypothetical protein ACFFDN_17650 [Candidatus Hodarchaeota archaeon]
MTENFNRWEYYKAILALKLLEWAYKLFPDSPEKVEYEIFLENFLKNSINRRKIGERQL